MSIDPKEFEINSIIFTILHRLGQGTYGEVYKAINESTTKEVAIKRIKSGFDDKSLSSNTLRELSLLQHLNHVNIVNLLDKQFKRGHMYMVFEYCDMDLHKLLCNQNKPLAIEVIKNYTYQIFQGILYCHNGGVLHRDLKPQNILVDIKQDIIKLADFGLARSFQDSNRPFTHEVVTLWYRAPEILLHANHYSYGIDVWSAGCIFAELFSMNVLFEGECEIDQIYKIFRGLGTPTEEIWPGFTRCRAYNFSFPIWLPSLPTELDSSLTDAAKNLLGRMLTYDTKSRITIADALKHEFFSEIRVGKVPSYGLEYENEEEYILKAYEKYNEN